MEKSEKKWSPGDTCVMIVSKQKRYAQEFEVQGFDGRYYTVRRGNSLHHVSPNRMFESKEAAFVHLDEPTQVAAEESPPADHAQNREMEEGKMNEWERNRQMVERYKEAYPPGTRILLLSMGDDPRPIEDNTRGTVKVVDDIGTLHCSFDNGRQLGIVPGEDSFRKLTEKELAEEQNQNMDEDNAPVMGM